MSVRGTLRYHLERYSSKVQQPASQHIDPAAQPIMQEETQNQYMPTAKDAELFAERMRPIIFKEVTKIMYEALSFRAKKLNSFQYSVDKSNQEAVFPCADDEPGIAEAIPYSNEEDLYQHKLLDDSDAAQCFLKWMFD